MRITLLSIFLPLILSLPAMGQWGISDYAGDGVPALRDARCDSAQFNGPVGIAVANTSRLTLFVTDALNNCIRKIDDLCTVTTFAGGEAPGYADGKGAAAMFNQPWDIFCDSDNTLFVTDFNNQVIRRIAPDGTVTTLAGKHGVAGYADAHDTNAVFNYPRGIAKGADGALYIGDSWNHRIRRVTMDGTVTTFAGGGTSMGVQSAGDYVDGPDTSARFWTPCGLAFDPTTQRLLVADAYTHRIRSITPSGVVSTLAGSGPTSSAAGAYHDDSLLAARFNTPTEVACSANGDVFVGDLLNHSVRWIVGGIVLTAAGDGNGGHSNTSPGRFYKPRGVASVGSANLQLLVADYGNNSIRLMMMGDGVRERRPSTAHLQVVPNPAPAVCTVSGFASTVGVQIVDALGRGVNADIARSGDRASIDLSGLPAGPYIVRAGAARAIVIHTP
jgi:DNA-binding beta-propeller fold protein YncE